MTHTLHIWILKHHAYLWKYTSGQSFTGSILNILDSFAQISHLSTIIPVISPYTVTVNYNGDHWQISLFTNINRTWVIHSQCWLNVHTIQKYTFMEYEYYSLFPLNNSNYNQLMSIDMSETNLKELFMMHLLLPVFFLYLHRFLLFGRSTYLHTKRQTRKVVAMSYLLRHATLISYGVYSIHCFLWPLDAC